MVAPNRIRAWAAGVSPTTSSNGRGSCGSMKTSSEPALGQVLTCATTPGKCSGAWSGAILTRRGWASPIAIMASRRTSPSEQLPPTQPQSLPSAVITALSPACADVGGSTRTTVATTKVSPRRRSSAARSSTSSASDIRYALLRRADLIQSRPDLVRGDRHVDVRDAQVSDRIDHGVDEGRRRADRGRLTDPFSADRVVGRRRDRLAYLELRRLPARGQQVIGEIGAEAVAFLVERDQLHERDAKTLGEA